MSNWIRLDDDGRYAWVNLDTVQFIRQWEGHFEIGLPTEIVEVTIATGEEILRRLELSREDTKD